MHYLKIYKTELVREGSLKYEENSITGPKIAAEILQDYLRGVDREHFVVLMLNAKNKVIGINTVSVGTIDTSLIHPRETFKAAILCNASRIILGHNHPSGDPYPSKEDKMITERLKEAGKILGIQVLDHIVIGDKKYFSFEEDLL